MQIDTLVCLTVTYILKNVLYLFKYCLIFTDSCSDSFTSLNLNANIVEIKQQIKHNISGKYPFITYKKPEAIDVIASA